MSISPFVYVDSDRISGKALAARGLHVSIRRSRYPGGSALRMSIENRGAETVLIERVGVRLDAPRGRGKGRWRVFLDQGSCGWCGVQRLEALGERPYMKPVRDQRFADETNEAPSFHRSDLQAVVWDTKRKAAMLVGFLRQRHGRNKIDILPTPKADGIAGLEAWQEFGIELAPGKAQELDVLVVAEGDDPHAMLERFGRQAARHHGRRFDPTPMVGMMTWYGYRSAIDEEIILSNAKIVGELFGGYPQKMLNVMLLDHGWQEDANWGYWHADRKRFPHGMKWLSGKLAKAGMKLGLWYTPFCVTDNAPNSKKLLALAAKDSQGKPKGGICNVWGTLPGHPYSRPITFLDGRQSAVQDIWHRDFARMRKWGCVYWKLDFFALMTSDADKATCGVGELYARTWRNFRRSAGATAHLAPCSCDTNLQVGYCDSVRIGADIGNAGGWPGAMDPYRYALAATAGFWYKHRNCWINDPDSIQLAKGCSLSEARIRATVAALSGGHLMLSESLRDVDNERIEMIRRLIPPCPQAARPLDLFENPFPEGYPSLWSLPLKTGFGPATTLAVFNLTRETKTFTITPQMLGIKPGKEFLVLEWWQCKWVGRFRGEFKIDVPPEDVAVLHAQPARRVPWLLSVSHHITGGYIVEDVSFDGRTGKLTGTLATKAGLKMVLFGHLPKAWTLAHGQTFHAGENAAGGWQAEVATARKRTRFEIRFERRN